MDLPMSSFVSHSPLLIAKSADLAVAHDGFPLKQKSSVFFIVAILIYRGAFQTVIYLYGLNIADNET